MNEGWRAARDERGKNERREKGEKTKRGENRGDIESTTGPGVIGLMSQRVNYTTRRGVDYQECEVSKWKREER